VIEKRNSHLHSSFYLYTHETYNPSAVTNVEMFPLPLIPL
jgi:hypothetical protein